jgi:hypothetical protein
MTFPAGCDPNLSTPNSPLTRRGDAASGAQLRDKTPRPTRQYLPGGRQSVLRLSGVYFSKRLNGNSYFNGTAIAEMRMALGS